MISPNGNGVNDTLRVHVAAPPGSVLGLRAYAWGGRLVGWKRIRTGVTVDRGFRCSPGTAPLLPVTRSPTAPT